MSYRKLQLWIHREKDEVSLTSSLVITRSNEIRAQMCDGNIAWSQHTKNEKPRRYCPTGSSLYGDAADNSGLNIGSSGRTRTYNPSVNSRMLCH